MQRLDLGDGAVITPTTLTTRSMIGRWVAKVTGPDRKYVLEREFLPDSKVTKRMVEGKPEWTATVVLAGPGLYEYRGVGEHGELAGFFAVVRGAFRSRVELVSPEEAFRRAGAPWPPLPPAPGTPKPQLPAPY